MEHRGDCERTNLKNTPLFTGAVRRAFLLGLLSLLAVVLAPRPAQALLGTSDANLTNYTDINANTGSNALWGFGPSYFGTNVWAGLGQGATIAVIDAGLIDNTHPDLTNVNTFFSLSGGITSTPASSLIGAHATACGMIAAGQGSFNTTTTAYNPLGFGIAPMATLWSGAVISSGDANSESFTMTAASFTSPFVTAMQTGINGVKADVVSCSFGDSSLTNGFNVSALTVDALVASTHIPVVIAAGNSGPGPNSVGAPACGYNKICVGALGGDPSNVDLTYRQTATFSSGGPNDFYNPYTGVTIPNARAVVDISAPGVNIVTASSPPTPSPYIFGSGTSFATPIVAGAIAQLVAVDRSYQNALWYYPSYLFTDLQDARVLKALLLNSADKPAGWNNGQQMVNGVITTTQALDYNTGAGCLNVGRAADNWLSATGFDPKITGPVSVNNTVVGPKGWDLSTVTQSTPNEYDLGNMSAGDTLTTTLDWFVNSTLPVDENNLVGSAGSFDNLFLQVLENLNGNETLVASSQTLYDNVQHLWLQVPSDGDYIIRVSWAGEQYGPVDSTPPASTDYALAWSNDLVPEPVCLLPVLAGLFILRRPHRRHGAPCAA